MIEELKTKLGTAKGAPRSRIWIEGKRLAAAGFTVGTRYTVEKIQHLDTGAPIWSLKPDPAGERKVSGKGDHPIIDITGVHVAAAFGQSERVRVLFDSEGREIIFFRMD